MNPDLAQERRRATFDPEQVTSLLYRGPENVRKRRYLRTYSVCVLPFFILLRSQEAPPPPYFQFASGATGSRVSTVIAMDL